MEHQLIPEHEALMIRPKGVLDAVMAPVIESLLHVHYTEDVRNLIVDCSQLEMVASSGLQLFLASSRTARLRGGRILLVAVNDQIRGVFKITRLERFFDFEDSLAAARMRLGRAGDTRHG